VLGRPAALGGPAVLGRPAALGGPAVLGALALAAAGVLLAGCAGGGSASNGSLARPTTSPGSVEAAALAFARCMRSGGVPNFPDPRAGGGFLFHTGAGVDPSSPAFQAAQAKCRRFLPPGPGSGPPPSAQAVAKMLGVARCMRGHGVPNFPDPRTTVPSNPRAALGGSGKGVISDIEGVILVFGPTIEMQSPAFTRAADACGFPLHNH
jgi:hypothetical protein